MKTNSKYQKNLKNNIITTSMLEDALFSVNKRAKNYRDVKRGCKYNQTYYNSAENKEQNFYSKKDKLLKLLEPICIHKEFMGYETVRIKSNRSDFNELYFQHLMQGDIVHTNYYIERDWDFYTENYVFFFDYAKLNCPKYNYYLYYVVGEHSFHIPISELEVDKYSYKVEVINRLNTEGHMPDELMSVQFVDKMIALIESGECTYVQDKETVIPEYDNTIKPYEPNIDINEAATLLKDEIYKYSKKKSEVLSFSELDWYKFKFEKRIKKNKVKIKISYPEPKQPDIDNVFEFLCQNYYDGAPLIKMAYLYIEQGFAEELIKYFATIKTIQAIKDKITSEAKKYPELKFEELPIYIENNTAYQLKKLNCADSCMAVA